jgi:hypothetical protein
MVRSVNRNIIALGLSLATIVSGAAFGAGTKILELEVSGLIVSAPEWRDETGSSITKLIFDFGENIAGDAIRNIDSLPKKFKLFGAKAWPASVSVAKPAGCKIGSADVTDSHVQVMFQGSVATGSIQLDDDSNRELKI